MKQNIKYSNKVASKSVYEIITDRIVEQLGQGMIPWQQPWVGGSQWAISYSSRKPYSMLNQFLLGKPGEWLTWNDIQAMGGRVKKGAKSAPCVWTRTVTKKKESKEEESNDGKAEVMESVRYLKWYRVFHIDDTEGIQSKIEQVTPNPDLKPLDEAEKIIAGYLGREEGLEFKNDEESDSAYYSLSKDKVVVPMLRQYEIAEEYYSTTFHELIHSTMKASRCNRETDNKLAAFRSKDYSREELVAEIGSAFLMNSTGIEIEKTFKNSVAYIKNWIKALEDDNKMISWAATRAEKAVKYILNGPQIA